VQDVVIISAARTAVGQFGQCLKDVPAVKLGALVMNEALKRAGLRPSRTKDKDFAPAVFEGKTSTALEEKYYDFNPSLKEVEIDEVRMGNVVQAGLGQNPARQSSIMAGIPKETNALTINMLCGSGLRSIADGALAIMAGAAEVIVAGGMENMSQVPYILPDMRWGGRMGHNQAVDLLLLDGLWEGFYGYHMGMTAENIAEKYGITREEQDAFGLLSHQRARKAIKEGISKSEIVPVAIPQKKGDPLIFDVDERPMDTTLEKMRKLPAAFKKDGSVTAGNASGINDAAAAVVIMSRDKAKALHLTPIAKIVSFAAAGVDPAYMGLGPVPAVRKALKYAGLTLDQMDMIELNEAFAAQALACIRELKIDMEKTNLHGGGISIGHPIGCTGARLITTLCHQMMRLGHRYGLATMCIGGGQGMAMIIEQEKRY
jgi:acetyl-CoA C-acetyltransferase